MKRILCILTILAILTSLVNTVTASQSDIGMWTELETLGIFKGHDDGTFGEDEPLTRAELSALAVRFLGFDEVAEAMPYSGVFSDVKASDWYAPVIDFVYKLGVINGYPDGTFRPMQNVSLDEAVRIVISAMGYEVVAQNNGGYPNGYKKAANDMQLLKDVNINGEFTRSDAAHLIYNALFADVVDPIYSNAADIEYTGKEKTYYDRLMSARGMYLEKGVVRADVYTYIDVPVPGLGDTEAVIGNVVYDTGDFDVNTLLGKEVYVYSKKDKRDGYVIYAVFETADNTEIIIDVENIFAISQNEIEYYDESDKKRTLGVDTDTVIYNGTPITFDEFDISKFVQGNIRCISNDGDSSIDVIFVNSYESAVVDKVNQSVLTFLPSFTLDGKKYFSEKDNTSIRYSYYDSEGNAISFADIKPGDVISLMKDTLGSRYKIYVSQATADGNVSSISDKYIEIDGKKFLKPLGVSALPKPGKAVVAKLDYNGKIVYIKTVEGFENYAYVLGISSETFEKTKIQLLKGCNPQLSADVNDSDADNVTSTPLLLCQNTGIEIYELTEKCNINGSRLTAAQIDSLLSANPVIKYETNSDGEIRKIETLTMYAGDQSAKLKYNVYDKTFGGNEFIDGVQICEETVTICIPTSPGTLEDYLVTTRIDVAGNSIGYVVQGFEQDEDTKKAKLAVITMGMDAGLVRTPSVSSSKAAMVLESYLEMDKNGDTYYNIKLLENNEEKEFNSVELSASNSVISSLGRGDLITYIKNAAEEIENVKLIHSFGGVTSNMDRFNSADGYREIFGTVSDIEYNMLNNAENYLASKVTISYSSTETATISVPVRNQPNIYLYDAGGQVPFIKSISMEEIEIGSDKCYMVQVGGTTVKTLVVVRGGV